MKITPIRPTQIWATKTWSHEITTGIGFPLDFRKGSFYSVESTVLFKKEGATEWTTIDPRHAHTSQEAAIDRAKKETMDYASYNEEKAAEYKEEAMKLRSELVKMNQR